MSKLNPSMIRKIVDSINKSKKCFLNQYLFCFQTKKNFLFHPGRIFVIELTKNSSSWNMIFRIINWDHFVVYSVNKKPRFEKPLRDQFCKDGSTVTLECVISGDPRPRTTWFKEGEEILDCQVPYLVSQISAWIL